MTKAHAIVPIVGGTALIVGGISALVCDVMDMRADPTEPRPIWVRYTSQATFDLKARSHWIFLSAIVIFAPCLMVTAQWQASLADDDDRAIVLHATLCALGGFLVALLPMGNALGTGIHMITAACFAAFGINYAFRAWDLAVDRGSDTLASVRLVLGLIGSVGGGLAIFSIQPATSGTEALEKHKRLVQKHGTQTADNLLADMPGFLTERQRMWARLGETVLAVGQISIAITMAVTLLTGAAEAIEVQDSSNAVWIVGVVASLGMMTLAAGFYATNNWWYATCQAKKNDDDNNDDDDDDDGDQEGRSPNNKKEEAPDVVE